MLVVVVFIEAQRGREDDLREAIVGYSRICLEREPGCRRYDVCLDPVEPKGNLGTECRKDNLAGGGR